MLIGTTGKPAESSDVSVSTNALSTSIIESTDSMSANAGNHNKINNIFV